MVRPGYCGLALDLHVGKVRYPIDRIRRNPADRKLKDRTVVDQSQNVVVDAVVRGVNPNGYGERNHAVKDVGVCATIAVIIAYVRRSDEPANQMDKNRNRTRSLRRNGQSRCQVDGRRIHGLPLADNLSMLGITGSCNLTGACDKLTIHGRCCARTNCHPLGIQGGAVKRQVRAVGHRARRCGIDNLTCRQTRQAGSSRSCGSRCTDTTCAPCRPRGSCRTDTASASGRPRSSRSTDTTRVTLWATRSGRTDTTRAALWATRSSGSRCTYCASPRGTWLSC